MMKRRAEGARDADIIEPAHAAPDEAARRQKSRRAVIIYIVTLFAVAILFTVLSYFVQTRHDREVSELTQKHVTAMAQSSELLRENEALKQERDALEEERDSLKERLRTAEDEKIMLEQAAQLKEEEFARLVEQYNELARKYGQEEYRYD